MSTSATTLTTQSNLLVRYIPYSPVLEDIYLEPIRALISKDLSEPYSIYVYRYFLYEWPELCFLAVKDDGPDEDDNERQTPPELVGVVVCKLAPHPTHLNNIYCNAMARPTPAAVQEPSLQEQPSPAPLRGYIAMLATSTSYRNRGIAKTLVTLALDEMIARGADEIVLETEVDNVAALRLYENLGFLRMKRLGRYYLNGNEAYRLGLWVRGHGYDWGGTKTEETRSTVVSSEREVARLRDTVENGEEDAKYR